METVKKQQEREQLRDFLVEKKFADYLVHLLKSSSDQDVKGGLIYSTFLLYNGYHQEKWFSCEDFLH